jgi:hypothetical protein
MAGERLQKLIASMGERRAYAHIERILQLSAHTATCILGETAATPARRAETQMIQRLREYSTTFNLGLSISDSHSTPHSGDALIRKAGVTTVWDSKNYARAVPIAQRRKLARDVRERGAAYGVIVQRGDVGIGHRVIDGVRIHTCQAGTASEFACLYLATLQTEDDVERTRHAANAALTFTIIENMQRNLDELKATLLIGV